MFLIDILRVCLVVTLLFHQYASCTDLVEICPSRLFLDDIVLRRYLRKCWHEHDLEETDPYRPRLVKSFADWSLARKQRLFEEFPLDSELRNFVRTVRDALFSRTDPTPLKGKVTLVSWSEDVLRDCLDLDPEFIINDKGFIDVVSGNALLKSSTPLTHRYGGHQFGAWAGQLGDGRAHMLGEYVSPLRQGSGGEGGRWELQLKGSGRTPYSRQGDGRAVLRSSVREFLASEAMHALGVPTSRAATLVMAEELVKRDEFYEGHVTLERTAVVLRLARSWFRFGSLEILARSGELNLLRRLVDFVVETHFTEIRDSGSARYLALFDAVVTQTARLIARWMSIGFAHGVCNTDNFSILSATIDYGPFRFIDRYHLDTVPNTSDDERRYSFGNQPAVGRYNLERLGEALPPLLPPSERGHLNQVLASYWPRYKKAYRELFRAKLGLSNSCSFREKGGGAEVEDDWLIATLLSMMQDTESDFTMTFRQLGDSHLVDLRLSSDRFNHDLWQSPEGSMDSSDIQQSPEGTSNGSDLLQSVEGSFDDIRHSPEGSMDNSDIQQSPEGTSDVSDLLRAVEGSGDDIRHSPESLTDGRDSVFTATHIACDGRDIKVAAGSEAGSADDADENIGKSHSAKKQTRNPLTDSLNPTSMFNLGFSSDPSMRSSPHSYLYSDSSVNPGSNACANLDSNAHSNLDPSFPSDSSSTHTPASNLRTQSTDAPSFSLWALAELRLHAEFPAWLDRYAARLRGCNITEPDRRAAMRHVNPRYVLRNWMAQQAIEGAQRGDFTFVRELHEILKDPFTVQGRAEARGYADPPPPWGHNVRVSCSS